ncbi:MAG: response regulator transcription factor [Roseburia sp.]|nr:response regulator transcription factor [Roseburia sp.]
MAEILIVEDEELINDLIRENLVLTGHNCTQVYDGKKAKDMVREQHFDLVLLDLMLPGCSGYDVLENCNDTPVIILTAKDDVQDKVRGLNRGAEDYIVKPFDMLELIARVNVVLRRNEDDKKEVFSAGEMSVDLQSHIVSVSGKEVLLTLKEYELLEYFIRNRNIALSRDRLIEQVWGYDYGGDTRTVDVHVAALRHKLNLGSMLKTVYKLGYRMEVL